MVTPAALRALRSRDSRFDGLFFYAVTTTGIFCRPSCPASPARAEHIQLFPTADGAIAAGFRCCKRCRPGSSPGAPEWNIGSDLARRAVRLIADGATDEGGIGILGRTLGYSDRQVRRTLVAEVGASPVALARSRRANAARVLLETTSLSNVDVAFTAGFHSLRQLHETLRVVYDRTPTELRAPKGAVHSTTEGTLTLHLAYRQPLALAELFSDLAADAVTGVSVVTATTFRRALRLPRSTGEVTISPGRPGDLLCEITLRDLRDLPVAVTRIRRYLDLDADPHAVSDLLGRDRVLGKAVMHTPGLRNLGALDPTETICTLISAEWGTSRPRKLLGTILGAPELDPPDDQPVTLTPYPTATALLEVLRASSGTAHDRRVTEILGAVAEGSVDLSGSADPGAATRALLEIGVPTTVVAGVQRRIFGDPDVLDPDASAALGGDRCDQWRPWRSYGSSYLRIVRRQSRTAHPPRSSHRRSTA